MKARSRKVFAIAAMLNLACLLPGETKNSDEQSYIRAQALMKNGHNDEAARILVRIVQDRPNDARLLVELGDCYMTDFNDISGGIMKAELYFRKAIKIDPQYGRAYYKMTEWANAQGKHELAVQMATKAIKAKQPDLQAYMERSAALSRLHRDREALADMDKYIASGKRKNDAYLRRASILENLHMYERALNDYRHMQAISYQDHTALLEAGCLEKINKLDEALKCLTDLIKRNPQDDSGYEARARLYAKQGKLKESLADYTKTLQLIPSATILKERATVYEKLGRKDLAEKDRREADKQ